MMTLNSHGIREGSKEDRPDEEKVKEREKEKAKAEEEEDSSDQGKEKAEEREEKAEPTWWVKKDMKKKDMKKMNGMKEIPAIGPKIRTGMKATGPMMIYTTWMSMDTSRRKEKERKERKARKEKMMMAKEENQEMEKASPTMFNLRPHHLQHQQFKINLNNLITQQLLALDMDSSHSLMMIPFMLKS